MLLLLAHISTAYVVHYFVTIFENDEFSYAPLSPSTSPATALVRIVWASIGEENEEQVK